MIARGNFLLKTVQCRCAFFFGRRILSFIVAIVRSFNDVLPLDGDVSPSFATCRVLTPRFTTIGPYLTKGAIGVASCPFFRGHLSRMEKPPKSCAMRAPRYPSNSLELQALEQFGSTGALSENAIYIYITTFD